MRKLIILCMMLVIFSMTVKQENFYFKLIVKIKDKITEYKTTKLIKGFTKKKLISVDKCDLNNTRLANVVVDIGVGKRKYYAKTNEYMQVDAVYARRLSLQNQNEITFTTGRYCQDEAPVFGTELKTYDQGHLIADSLGGASNAYNITAQNSNLNRFGLQRKMEKEIQNALLADKNVENFYGKILYDNNKSMIPSSYIFTFTIDKKYERYQFSND